MIVSVIGGTALVVYFFMWIGRLPVGLLLALAAGALFTVIKCIQTLFVRVPFEAPGRSLEPAEAPGLWSLTRQVAEAIGTRPVDEVRVTPGTDMAVYERGSRRDRRQDRARRVLLLGVGLIDGFRQAPFCSVLAHEYGHFAHRDTAGGDLALRVNNDMIRFAVVLAQNGQAVWWNLAWQFLRAYAFLFRRITHGATRLQEVLADRVAAAHYGTANFEEGLRHVVRRHVEFNAAVNQEVEDALQHRRALRNLYSLEAPHTSELEQEIENALSRPTSEDDTHPGPEERFRLLYGVRTIDQRIVDGMVWELFADRDAVTNEMTSQIASQLTTLHEPELVTATA